MEKQSPGNEVIKVLIVEDSLVCAEIIKHILETDPSIKVVGQARDGLEATELVPLLKPDIITMDIHMPRMNGLEATEHIMAYNPTPILIVSSSIRDRDTELAFQATQAGALDVIEKPDPAIWESFAEIGNELLHKVKLLSRVKVITHIRGKQKKRMSVPHQATEIRPHSVARHAEAGVVVIGSSTGGPQALARVLAPLPKDFPLPIVVAQHISEGFLSGFLNWLRTVSRLEVVEAREMDELVEGKIFVSPTNRNLAIVEPGVVELVQPKPNEYYNPSIDLLFSSAANVYRSGTIGVLLTGMGSDGARGLKKIFDLGGHTIAQSEETCVVFGMPKAAIDLGAAREILPIDEIGERLRELGKQYGKREVSQLS